MTIPRIREEELFALAAFASPIGVHLPNPSHSRRRPQTRRRSCPLGSRGKKINPAQEDLSWLKAEVNRPEENPGFQTAGFNRVSSRRWHKPKENEAKA
jgi:hypothetical protein